MPQPVPDMVQGGRVIISPGTAIHKIKNNTNNGSLDLATNGATATPPARASPVPQAQGAAVPAANGKPVAPLVERSNVMSTGPNSPTPQTVSSKDPKAAAAAASDMRNIVRRKLTGFVGFANLPNQWHRKSVRKGFNFNVMVVGMFMSPASNSCIPALLSQPHTHIRATSNVGCQVNPASESRRSSTPFSTHLSIRQRKPSSPVSTLHPAPWRFNPSVPTLKRMESACD